LRLQTSRWCTPQWHGCGNALVKAFPDLLNERHVVRHQLLHHQLLLGLVKALLKVHNLMVPLWSLDDSTGSRSVVQLAAKAARVAYAMLPEARVTTGRVGLEHRRGLSFLLVLSPTG
jgi:hypothetical protein